MRSKFWVFILKCLGWTITGDLPQDKKYIVIVAPHTSNWDFFICLFGKFALNKKVTFLAKKQAFVFPFKPILEAFGGIPLDRSQHQNLVEAIIDLFNSRDELIYALAPEGTRSPVKRWKTGFYHIACAAKIPIVMFGPDFSKKTIVIAPAFWPTGDINKDFPEILAFFRGIKGRHPKEIPDFTPEN